jgi:hypothetical protein
MHVHKLRVTPDHRDARGTPCRARNISRLVLLRITWVGAAARGAPRRGCLARR